MPYIAQEDREYLSDIVKQFNAIEFENPGQVNYLITELLKAYTVTISNKVGYTTINEVIGILECAKQEFYRRIASPYEDHKISENGDVYNDK